MNKNLLIVCGPTATGKTKLAFKLAKQFNGELISADSRMVYKFMDIGTGKDIKKYGKISGYDLVNPNEEFSIADYSRFAHQKIKEIQGRNKLPVLVGGSGLYIKSVTDEINTIDIPTNKSLRENLKDKSTDELVKILESTNRKKFESMNNSDRKNPRRLIRAIEIANQVKSEKLKVKNIEDMGYDTLFVGLMAAGEELKKRINKRVDQRLKMGLDKEIEFLKENGYWNYAPQKTLGYKDWPDSEKWKTEEFKYAKRQMTWFKKDSRINWFDITHKDFHKEVKKTVAKWYI